MNNKGNPFKELVYTSGRHVLKQRMPSLDAIVGILGDSVKVAVTAPPVDGKANAYVCKFLAGEFKTAKSNVSIIKGETSKHKRAVREP